LPHAPSSKPEEWLRFIQIDPFPGQWAKLKLADDDLRAIEMGIMVAPSGSPVVPGTNGLRKMRIAMPGSNRGKRGSYRVYYVYFQEYGMVLLMAILAKNDREDLKKSDKNALSQVITRLKQLLEAGAIR
jgi:hypothetical protein